MMWYTDLKASPRRDAASLTTGQVAHTIPRKVEKWPDRVVTEIRKTPEAHDDRLSVIRCKTVAEKVSRIPNGTCGVLCNQQSN